MAKGQKQDPKTELIRLLAEGKTQEEIRVEHPELVGALDEALSDETPAGSGSRPGGPRAPKL